MYHVKHVNCNIMINGRPVVATTFHATYAEAIEYAESYGYQRDHTDRLLQWFGDDNYVYVTNEDDCVLLGD